eukprot:COSAG02_NODE_732_length_17973_cov_6.920275_5_plen_65_part_00
MPLRAPGALPLETTGTRDHTGAGTEAVNYDFGNYNLEVPSVKTRIYLYTTIYELIPQFTHSNSI